MTLIRNYITLLGLLVSLTSFSQTTALRKIDNELTGIFHTMVNADYQLRFDSLAPAFKKQLFVNLVNPITFDNSLDSLTKYVTIKTAADGKIKFYSWDDLGGGTWRHINCIAQFKSDTGKILVQPLNSENEVETGEFTDSEVYEVYEIDIDKKTYYLTFSWGTHGSGHQHQIIQIFTIIEDRLTKCNSCIANSNELVITYPRTEKANLVFNQKTSEISYDEFKIDQHSGFYKPTGQVITLKLVNGKFTTSR
ncbi:MAG: hypothetical protein IPN74_08505 [Haliscomenobacter sp.]|nr:hypothetical protein [Haliscomenobacter sp.]